VPLGSNHFSQDEGVLEECEKDKEDTSKNPHLYCCDGISYRDSSRSRVEHVDKHEAKGDKKNYPGRHYVWGNEEGDPGHGDKHAGREVDGEDERTE